MENAEALAAIIGLINGFRLLEVNRKGFYYFIGAVVAGLLFGYLHWFGLVDLQAGLVVALASSGVYRVGQMIGGK